MTDEIELSFDIESELPLMMCIVDDDGDLEVQIDTDQLGHAQNAGLILAAIEQHLAGALVHMDAEPSQDAALMAIRTAYAAEVVEMTNENTGGLQ